MATVGTVRETVVRLSVEELGDHLATLEDELGDGRSIELVRGETVIAEVRAPRRETTVTQSSPRPIPDFMGRMKEIWGDQVFPEGHMTRLIREDRDARG